jgi:micrococcal nuclease
MFMVIGMLSLLAFLIFVLIGFVSLIRKKNWKRDFKIAAGAFVLFVAMVIVDSEVNPVEETTTQEQTANEEMKEEKKEEAEKAEPKKEEAQKEQESEPKEEPKEEAKKEEPKQAQPKTAQPKPAAPAAKGVPAKVVRVIDGDTIEVLMDGEQKEIRMLLIDTPETKHPSKPVEPFGPEASQFATETLKNKTVGIQVGKEKEDKYGRILAYVWVGGKTYQEMVLEKGLAATAYLYNDLTMLDQFHKAQDIARNKKIGVWSIPGYAHVDHDHGFHYEEGAKVEPAPAPKPKPAPKPAPAPVPAPEYFQNCTELRAVYPDGVPAGHPAYDSKHDRDKDNYACER